MPVGAYYIDKSELDEFAARLEEVAGSVKDLSKVYRDIGRRAGEYVKAHEPIYAGPTKGRRETIHLQDRTRGGGGKRGAYVAITGVPYLYVQEFGGTSYWYRGPAGLARAMNKGHKSYDALGFKANGTGHVIYKKPRRKLGYFIWNVAYRLRSYISYELTDGIRRIAGQHNISMDITDRTLDIKQTPFSGSRSSGGSGGFLGEGKEGPSSPWTLPGWAA